MTPAPGRLAFVTVNAATKTFDEWSVDLASDKADVSDFDQVCSQWLPGLPVALITLAGPYDVNALGVQPRQSYDVVLGLTASYGLPVTVLVTNVRPKTSARGVARVEVTGVVNSDFLTDPDILLL